MQDIYNLYHGNMESSKEPNRWVSLNVVLFSKGTSESSNDFANITDRIMRKTSEILQEVDNDGYDGWMSREDCYFIGDPFECFRTPQYDPETVKKSSEKLKEYIAEFERLKKEWQNESGIKEQTKISEEEFNKLLNWMYKNDPKDLGE